MMRATPIKRSTNPMGIKSMGIGASRHNHNNVCDQPYYLKPCGENPYLGCVHDGVTTEYHKGFSVKPIHHLYRFTHNLLPLNIPRGALRSPVTKRLHWMESTSLRRVANEWYMFEALPVFLVGVMVVVLTIYHLTRTAFYHPDITWYNLAFPTNKNFVPFVRFNQKGMLDQPVYRNLQQQSEFYFLDAAKRSMIELDLIANDPFINHVKEIGRGDELLVRAGSKGANKRDIGGQGGRGYLIPSVFEEKSSWWTPRAEQQKENPEKSFRENYGSPFFWSLYTNLYRL